jgi:ABC-2 type transport system ATP-binding protein
MIEARGLTRFYGERAAVSNLSFTVRPGVVTGFLGPNGAGKSTTMRLILGLDAPTAGDVRVNGRHYADHPAPLAEVGALLEARAIHPGRSARNHLLALAATHAISGPPGGPGAGPDRPDRCSEPRSPRSWWCQRPR